MYAQMVFYRSHYVHDLHDTALIIYKGDAQQYRDVLHSVSGCLEIIFD
jgi:hypothetical protein